MSNLYSKEDFLFPHSSNLFLFARWRGSDWYATIFFVPPNSTAPGFEPTSVCWVVPQTGTFEGRCTDWQKRHGSKVDVKDEASSYLGATWLGWPGRSPSRSWLRSGRWWRASWRCRCERPRDWKTPRNGWTSSTAESEAGFLNIWLSSYYDK